MTPYPLDELASHRRRERLLEAERERLASAARAGRVRRQVKGRTGASLGQVLAARREPVAR